MGRADHREEKFPEAQARELRNAAEFIMDMAYSVEDARKQVVERKNWIARDLRIQKLRGDILSENEKLTVYITDQLVGGGYAQVDIQEFRRSPTRTAGCRRS